MQVKAGARAPAFLHMVPKMVPQRGGFVAGVVRYNPKVVRSGQRARHVRVAVYRLLPSRVVLYRESTVRAASRTDAGEIASGR